MGAEKCSGDELHIFIVKLEWKVLNFTDSRYFFWEQARLEKDKKLVIQIWFLLLKLQFHVNVSKIWLPKFEQQEVLKLQTPASSEPGNPNSDA